MYSYKKLFVSVAMIISMATLHGMDEGSSSSNSTPSYSQNNPARDRLHFCNEILRMPKDEYITKHPDIAPHYEERLEPEPRIYARALERGQQDEKHERYQAFMKTYVKPYMKPVIASVMLGTLYILSKNS